MTRVWISMRVWLDGWVFVCGLSGCGFESRCCYSGAAPLSGGGLLVVRAVMVCRSAMGRVRGMIMACSPKL